MITSLQPNEVFIFGSNTCGFHGSGSAGLACRGDSRNTWRSDEWFLAAKAAPTGSPARIGKWAVYGIARGYQEGTEGKSYAIETIRFPGKKRSTPLQEIRQQLVELAVFAAAHSDLRFLMTPVGAGLAGWSNIEMKSVWDTVTSLVPDNVIVPARLYQDVDIWDT